MKKEEIIEIETNIFDKLKVKNFSFVKNEINFLIRKKENINFTDNNGNSLLHIIASLLPPGDVLDIAQFVLNNNIDTDMVNENFKTAKDIANNNNNIALISLINFYKNKQTQNNLDYFNKK